MLIFFLKKLTNMLALTSTGIHSREYLALNSNPSSKNTTSQFSVEHTKYLFQTFLNE